MAKTTKKKATRVDAPARGERRVVTGMVKSDKMDKTISVKIERLVKHPKFGKYIRRFTTCKAHDEKNEARIGDVVEITETRPLSASKRWRLTRVIRTSGVPDLVEESTS